MPPRLGERLVALDIGRALGVVAMVFGHTLDALLAPVVRAEPLLVAYWKARGVTAPLFLMVSGWAVTLTITRAPLRGWKLIRARLPRVVLLLALGYLLRFPGGNVQALLSGDRLIWQQFLAFDALHVLAVGLLCAILLLSIHRSRVEQGFAFLLLGAFAVAWGLSSPSPAAETPPELALAQAVGGTSPFPVFPWVAYFFFGAATPFLASDVRVRLVAGIACVVVFAAASVCWQGFSSMPPAHPVLVSFRVGVVLLLLTGCDAVPRRVASALAPVARSSLGVYVIHVPVVYGWFTLEGLSQRIGARLEFHEAALVALALLGCAIGAERLLARVIAAALGVAQRGLDRRGLPGRVTSTTG